MIPLLMQELVKEFTSQNKDRGYYYAGRFTGPDQIAELVVVGSAPTKSIQRSGLVFTGPQFENFFALFNKAELPPAYLTLSIKSFLYEPGTHTYRNPTNEEYRLYNSHLMDELALIKPKVVLLLGKHAAYTAFPNYRSTPFILLRGTHHSTIMPYTFIITHNPVILSHRKDALADLTASFATVKKYLEKD